jgi:SAM-dependent methyltransferase
VTVLGPSVAARVGGDPFFERFYGPRFPRQLLRVNRIRHWVAKLRFLWYARLRGRLRTLEGAGAAVAPNTVMHNLRGLEDFAVVRAMSLIHPLCAIETLGADARILSVGPRSEGELLALVAHGFRPENIRGLDLISYSPWVDLGDMHAMPYPAASFDAVVLGWVLAYSKEPAKAAAEVVRVARPGAIVAVGVEYNPVSDERIREEIGYDPGAPRRPRSVAEVLAFFGDAVGKVHYEHDVAPERRERIGSLCAVFSVRKP